MAEEEPTLLELAGHGLLFADVRLNSLPTDCFRRTLGTRGTALPYCTRGAFPYNPLKKKAPGYAPGAKSNREASRLGDVGSEDPEPRHCTWERVSGENPAGTRDLLQCSKS